MTDIALSPDGAFLVVPAATTLESASRCSLFDEEVRVVFHRDWASRTTRNVTVIEVLSDLMRVANGTHPKDPDNANSEFVAALLAVSATVSLRSGIGSNTDVPLRDLLSPNNDAWRSEDIESVTIAKNLAKAPPVPDFVSSHTFTPIRGRAIVSVHGHRTPEGSVTLAGVGFAPMPMVLEAGFAPTPPSDRQGSAPYRLALMRVHASRVAEALIGRDQPVEVTVGVGSAGEVTAEVTIVVDTGQMYGGPRSDDSDNVATENAARAVWGAVADALALDATAFAITSVATGTELSTPGSTIKVDPRVGLMPEVVWNLLQGNQAQQPLGAHSNSVGEI